MKKVKFMDFRDRHTSVPLTNFALGYRPEGFIADQVCPRVQVAKISDKYAIFGTENLKKIDTLRDPKDKSKGRTRTLSTTSYSCKPHSIHEIINDVDREAVPNGGNLENEIVEAGMDSMLISLEAEVATLMTTTSNYASSSFYTTLSDSAQWDDAGGVSTPLDDIVTGIEAVKNGCGTMPNAIVIPWNVATVLGSHPTVQALNKYTHPDLVSNLGLPPTIKGLKVFVAGAQHDETREGQSGMSLANIWGKDVVIFKLVPGAGWFTPAFCKTFSYGQVAFFVKRIPLGGEYLYNAQKIETVDAGRDPKMVGNRFGYVIKSAIS